MGKQHKQPEVEPEVEVEVTPEVTVSELDRLMAELNLPKEQAERILAAAKKGGSRTRRADETKLAKYPHVVPGSLGFNADANKQDVLIRCTMPGCTTERRVFTSDLFQVRVCLAHRKEQRSASRKDRQSLIKEAMKLIAKGKLGKAEVPAEVPAEAQA